jgi:rubrerythrin
MTRKIILCKKCEGSIKLRFTGVSIQDDYIEITYVCPVCGHIHVVIVEI